MSADDKTMNTTPTPQRKPFPFIQLLTAVLAVALIAGAALAASNRSEQRTAMYETALQELANADYSAAEQHFLSVPGYRDSDALSVYCKYAALYDGRTSYAGGERELSALTLQYEIKWQKYIDALERRIEVYKERKLAKEKERQLKSAAQAAARREDQLEEKYTGTQPADGIPLDALKYTTIGAPDKIEKCQFYDSMDEHRRYKILRWYDDNGRVTASCQAHIPKGEDEEIIYAFSYTLPAPAKGNSAPSNGNSFTSSDSGGGIWDDYDSPEDFWEDNRDIYEDEDEAWDEWYDY